MIQRLDELTGPVEVGKFYLVPTVEAFWHHRLMAWPVIGPKHSDAHCLNFAPHHYHLDPRFVASRRRGVNVEFWRLVAGAPLMTRLDPAINPGGLPEPVWRPRKCLRLANPVLEMMEDLARRHDTWSCHFDEWTGKQARHDGRGWVCPHRAVPLADHAPVDGVITCPLHMLRIDAATGIVLPPNGSEVADASA